MAPHGCPVGAEIGGWGLPAFGPLLHLPLDLLGQEESQETRAKPAAEREPRAPSNTARPPHWLGSRGPWFRVLQPPGPPKLS